MKYIKTIALLVLTAIISTSCAQEELKTDSGITYSYVEKGSGATPPQGGFWSLNVAYFDHTGKELFSTANQGGPLTITYMGNYPANGSIEECFTLVGEGDSAVFQISADSLYKYSGGRRTPEDLVGTQIQLQMGVDEVFTQEEYMNMMQAKADEQIAEEKETIEQYLADNNLTAQVTEEGLYYVIEEPGEGDLPQRGDMVSVAYTGYILDGTVFDSSIEEDAKAAGTYNPNRPYEPYAFALETGPVIRGWHVGMALLAKGGKAKLIIPSPLGYGTQQRSEIIKPNSILVFDVELVEIVKNENN